MGKKKDIIVKLLDTLIQSGSKTLEFDNKMVKAVTGGTFANQFDATKFDNTDKLPQALKDRDYFIIHLGSGKHRFVKGIKLGYHCFEKISQRDTIDWKYRKSILNETDTSEARFSHLSITSESPTIFFTRILWPAPKFTTPAEQKLLSIISSEI